MIKAMMNDKQDMLNILHSNNPKPGDFWHECYTPIAVVIEVTDFCVVFCDKTMPHPDGNGRTWDTSKISVMTRSQYRNRWRYGRIDDKENFVADDDSADIKHKCWCDVLPEHYKPITVRGWFTATE